MGHLFIYRLTRYQGEFGHLYLNWFNDDPRGHYVWHFCCNRLAALESFRPQCEHGQGLTDYCQPCGRIHSA